MSPAGMRESVSVFGLEFNHGAPLGPIPPQMNIPFRVDEPADDIERSRRSIRRAARSGRPQSATRLLLRRGPGRSVCSGLPVPDDLASPSSRLRSRPIGPPPPTGLERMLNNHAFPNVVLELAENCLPFPGRHASRIPGPSIRSSPTSRTRRGRITPKEIGGSGMSSDPMASFSDDCGRICSLCRQCVGYGSDGGREHVG